MGITAAAAVVAAAGVTFFTAAEPRYVALCSTDGQECATASVTADGSVSETPQIALVSLDERSEVNLVNNNGTGTTGVSVLGYFDGEVGDLGAYTPVTAASSATIRLADGETRTVSLPSTPREARIAVVQIKSLKQQYEADKAAGKNPAMPTATIGTTTVSLDTVPSNVTPDQVLQAIERWKRSTATPTTAPTTPAEKDTAAQVAESTQRAAGTDSGTATNAPATSTPSASTPATGTPATGTPATGTPSSSTPSTSTPTTGTPTASTPGATTPTTSAPAPAPVAPAPVAPAPAPVAPAPAPAAPAPAAPAPAAPAPTSGHGTGVPAGVKLKVVYGDQTITTPGAVIDGLDIHGRVIVKAANVTIKNSIIRGSDSGSANGLVDAMTGATGLKIYDSEIVAIKPNPSVNGIMGWNFELHRVNIHGTVDQVHIAGSNVLIKDSWLHNSLHYPAGVDPHHADGSHDDNIQIVGGSNITITGNVLSDTYNAAIMIGQDRSKIGNLTITGNRLDYGGCTINVAEKDKGPLQGVSIKSNTFGFNTRHAKCAIVAPSSTPIAQGGNVFTDGSAVTVRKG